MAKISPTPRSIDRRLSPAPRSYLQVPELFGVVPSAAACLPDDGTEREQRLALYLHRRSCDYRAVSVRGDQADLCNEYHVSTTVVSDTLTGKRWPNVTVLLAILVRLDTPPAAPGPPTPPAPSRTRLGFPVARRLRDDL